MLIFFRLDYIHREDYNFEGSSKSNTLDHQYGKYILAKSKI